MSIIREIGKIKRCGQGIDGTEDGIIQFRIIARGTSTTWSGHSYEVSCASE